MKTFSAGGFLHGQRRLFSFVLMGMCLGIWSYVLFQRIARLPQEDAERVTPGLLAPESEARWAVRRAYATARYDSTFRDPFALPPEWFAAKVADSRSRRPLKTTPPVSPPVAPQLTLCGIVGETALLQNQAGAVLIARVGEQAEGAQILTVERDRIVVRFQGRSHTLQLMH